jgi:hypothetical protein
VWSGRSINFFQRRQYNPTNIKVFYLPTDAQALKKILIYVKIDIKTAPTCFGAVTPSSGNALLVLAKVTVVKIAN